MIHEFLTKHSEKVRFGAVGVLNTLTDFVLLNILAVLLGLPVVAANTISTGISMIGSFLLNKKWTFRASGKNYLREVGLFFGFTIIGMWGISNGIMFLLVPLMPSDWLEIVRVSLPKIVATLASLTWNYFSYKYIVFKKSNPKNS